MEGGWNGDGRLMWEALGCGSVQGDGMMAGCVVCGNTVYSRNRDLGCGCGEEYGILMTA